MFIGLASILAALLGLISVVHSTHYPGEFIASPRAERAVSTDPMLLVYASLAGLGLHNDDQHELSLNGVPAMARTHWMRIANAAVPEIMGNPCNPSMHGEITGLQRCTEVLSERGLTPGEILNAWKDLTMYTTGEPCPMCASALRWAGIGEVVWATSIETLIKGGYGQIYLPSSLIVSASYTLPHHTLWYGSVLANETDPYFSHLNNESALCPEACERILREGKRVTECVPTAEWTTEWEKRKGQWEKKLMESKGHGHVRHTHDEL
ncbi:SPOSA6832_04514, partial [Sporobolomyces salmonicolor]